MRSSCLLLTATSPVDPLTPVTISVAGPPEYRETDTNDNARPVYLQPAPVAATSSSLSSQVQYSTELNEYVLSAGLRGVPDAATSITFRAARANGSPARS